MKVGVFITCMANVLRPTIGHALITLIKSAGFTPIVPSQQTCCGQPAFNSGCTTQRRNLADHFRTTFEHVDLILVPSASCLSTVQDYGDLGDEFRTVVDKTIQLESFVLKYISPDKFTNSKHRKIVLHDSCSSLRRTHTAKEVHTVLGNIPGCEVVTPEFNEECCGFGGSFAVKFGDLSTEFADSKLKTLNATDAPSVVSCDLGCLLHLEGRASRKGMGLNFFHTAEILAEALANAD